MYIPYSKKEYVDFEYLLGKTLVSVNVDTDDYSGQYIKFVTSEGETFMMYHEQDCCESVSIESIEGELSCLVGNPILLAEEVTKYSDAVTGEDAWDESQTWTFYKLATIKGYVDIRWYGSSNGYYSERVDFVKLLQ